MIDDRQKGIHDAQTVTVSFSTVSNLKIRKRLFLFTKDLIACKLNVYSRQGAPNSCLFVIQTSRLCVCFLNPL